MTKKPTKGVKKIMSGLGHIGSRLFWIFMLFIAVPYYIYSLGSGIVPVWATGARDWGMGLVVNAGRPGLYVGKNFSVYVVEDGGEDGGFSGNLVMDGNVYPVAAQSDGLRSVSGHYYVEGKGFPFTLSKNIFAGLNGAVLTRGDVELDLFMVKPTGGSSYIDLSRYTEATWRNDDGQLGMKSDGDGSLLAIYKPKSGGKTLYRLAPEGDRVRGAAIVKGTSHNLDGFYNWKTDQLTLSANGNTRVFQASREVDRAGEYPAFDARGIKGRRVLRDKFAHFDGVYVFDQRNSIKLKVLGLPGLDAEDKATYGTPICGGTITSQWIYIGYDRDRARNLTSEDGDMLDCRISRDGELRIQYQRPLTYKDREGVRYQIDQAVFRPHTSGLYNVTKGQVYRRSPDALQTGTYRSPNGGTKIKITRHEGRVWYGFISNDKGNRHRFAGQMYGDELLAVFHTGKKDDDAKKAGKFILTASNKKAGVRVWDAEGLGLEDGDYSLLSSR